MSGLMSQRTVRVRRGTSLIRPADADLDKFDAAGARRAGLSEGEWSTAAEQSVAVGGDFLANSSDKNRNFPPPDDLGASVLGDFDGVVSDKASWLISGKESEVMGVVKLCQLRDLIARCRARCCT